MMSDEEKKYIEELKTARPWLTSFNLSDDEFYSAIVQGNKVIIGTESLNDLLDNLSAKIKSKDVETIKKIALEIAIHVFWRVRRSINGNVAEFIKSLGGVPPKPRKKKIRKGKDSSEKEPADYLIKKEEINNISNGSTAMTFSTMDEEELKKVQVPQPESYVVDYNVLADDIISEFRYNESDEILHKRLSNIIISRFRDVRDELESMDALTKSRKIGGMELTPDQATELLRLIKKKQESFKEHHISAQNGIQKIEFSPRKPVYDSKPKVKTLEEKKTDDIKRGEFIPIPGPSIAEEMGQTVVSNPITPKSEKLELMDNKSKIIENKVAIEDSTAMRSAPVPIMDEEDGLPILRMPEDLMVKPEILEIDQESLANEGVKQLGSGISPILAVSSEMGNQPKDNNSNNFVAEKSIPMNLEIHEDIKKSSSPLPRPAPYVVQKDIPQRVIESQNTRRPIVDGIKLTKKLTGPIEELGNMTLIDFRRLAPDPISATNEIKEKVKLLEEESYVRRMEGVDAWMGNEVNKFYRLLGQSSMAEGKSIDDVIKERLISGKPTLSMEEFHAVMQLNSELRY